MLEAVNSSLQNAALIKPVAAQTSSSESLAANPDRVQKAASSGSAPYVSPFIFMDSANEQVVLQIRNNVTGDAISQSASQAYVRPQPTTESAVALQAQQEIETQQTVTETRSTPAPQVQAQAQVQTPQQSAAFASASASGQQLESAGVSVFA